MTRSNINDVWKEINMKHQTEIFKVKSGIRRTISGTHRSEAQPTDDEVYWNACATEIDSHADTHCFGRNFRPIFWTGQECSVAPFLPEYDEQENVRICTGATAYTMDNGEVVILVFGQGLWFGSRMEKSLINPYQCRYYGIQLCNDPTDPHRDLGIQANETTFIPLEMAGSICGLITRYPTNDEMENCRHIELSNPHHWDPSTNLFQISLMRAEMIHDERSICQLEGISVGSSPITAIIDDEPIHEYDWAMASISLGLHQDILAKQIVSNVKVRKVNDQYSTITKDRHHGISAELISRKWGIGIEKACQTLKCTTQLSIRSAILPLTRRYRTDLMSQQLRRLSTTWYTDTLFAKEKSLTGNSCAQLYADGQGFINIYPMESKDKAGETLKSIVRDVGIPNTIISDNAPEQTGKNSTFQQTCRKYNIEARSTEPYSPWQNKAEGNIKIVKDKAKRRRIRRQVPKRVWDFGIVWEAEIYSCTAGKDGQTALERITGDTPDISEWIEFEFYDMVWYWDNQHDSKEPKIGRWLGIAHRVGSALCYWILSNKGNIYARTTVQPLMRCSSQRYKRLCRNIICPLKRQ